jgi:predicted nucleic acid-binding protein
MNGREFIDTNVLAYAHDERDPQKQAVARELIQRLLRERRGLVSLQVLREFFVVATTKLGMSSEEARQRMVRYSRFGVVTLDFADLLAATDLHRLHRWSLWDALIVRAALNGGCRTLHTEDMQPGYTVDALTLRNPFRAEP